MPRLFVSHSSKDNVAALAFQRWLAANGWSKEDVFIDLHGIGAGERWRDTLRKANASCEAVVLLASPDSVDSKECQREINLAEDLGKEIMVAILRDLQKDDPRLARYTDRQFVDLSAQPTERMDPFEHDGRVHRVEFHLPALASIKASLTRLGIAPGSFAWTPKEGASPYPGLAAFGENDAGIFFGREAEIMAGVTRLRMLRKRHAPRLLIIQAASGAGKSSFLRAGLWPRLERDPDFAPLAILRPALGIMRGPDGLGRRFASWFERHGVTKLPGDIHAQLAQTNTAAAALMELVREATALATTERRAGAPDARAPAPLIAIDQGEELFAAENVGESDRFLELLAGLLKDPPPEVDPYVLITIRADSVDALLRRWSTLGDTPETQVLAPLSPTTYRDVIVKPAEVYSEQVRRLSVEPALVSALVHDASGADALPLLAFTLERLFNEFGADGNLTLQRYDTMGGVGGSIDSALAEAQRQAGAGGTTENLRRLMVPGLATWDPAAGAAKRLVARDSDLIGGNRTALEPLCSKLVANRLLTEGAGTIEVAHEALLRRPPLAGWLEEEKDGLKLRDDMLREAKEWADGVKHDEGLVRRGARLESALDLLRREDFAAALAPARDYLLASQGLEAAGKRRARRAQALTYTLLLGIIASLVGFINQEPLKEQYRVAQKFLKEQHQWRLVMGPSVLSADQEKAKAGSPGSQFSECTRGCPSMVVVPSGKFAMSLPQNERVQRRYEGETDDDDSDGGKRIGPKSAVDATAIETGEPKNATDRPVSQTHGPKEHVIAIDKPFAVGKTAVTFAQWDVCVSASACPKISDNGWGRGDRPVILVSWDEAKGYVAWLSRMTGSHYRLLTEDEWEYAARAGYEGSNTFGDDPTKLAEHAWFIVNSKGKTEPVEKRKPNGFGLYDMHGNVWQWVEDCHHDEHDDVSQDGSARTETCTNDRVVRGGSWHMDPRNPSADRSAVAPELRSVTLGFRVGRTLSP